MAQFFVDDSLKARGTVAEYGSIKPNGPVLQNVSLYSLGPVGRLGSLS